MTSIDRGVEDLLALPAVADNVSAHHLEQQVGATARRMLLLHRGAVTGAHGSLFLAAAFTDADAA